MSFDNLRSSIPTAEAASFFLRVKWGSEGPPVSDEDEEGTEKESNMHCGTKKEALSAADQAGLSAASAGLKKGTHMAQNVTKLLKGAPASPVKMAMAKAAQDMGLLPPETQEYLQQEMAGEEAAEQASSQFYQQQAQAAQTQAADLEQQLAQTQEQLQQMQAQVDMSAQQIQAATQQAQMAQQAALSNVQQANTMASQTMQQALDAQREALRQKQLSVAMRLGLQTVKNNVMAAVQQDPTDGIEGQVMSDPAGLMTPQTPAVDPATGMPMDPAAQGAAPGAPAGDPAAAGAPAEGGPEAGAAPAEKSESSGGEKSESKSESSESSEKKDDKKSGGTTVKVEHKEASAGGGMAGIHQLLDMVKHRAPGMVGGAAVGAGLGAAGVHGLDQPILDKLRGRVTELENGDRGFGKALQLASAKALLSIGEAAQEHPGAAIGASALMGANVGAAAPELADKLRNIGSNLKTIKDGFKG